MSDEQKPSEFWAWMNKNVTGNGIIWFVAVSGWITYLILSVAN